MKEIQEKQVVEALRSLARSEAESTKLMKSIAEDLRAIRTDEAYISGWNDAIDMLADTVPEYWRESFLEKKKGVKK